jgi:ribosomal protein S19E (S16A)
MGLETGHANPDMEMMKLFDALIDVMVQSGRIKRDDASSRLIFEIYGMTENTKSRKFRESAIYVATGVANTLQEQGLVQKVVTEEGEKYALTFRGIARCVEIKYNKRLDEQFTEFLQLADQKFNTVEQTSLQWNERVATLSLILLASTSPSSAVRLNSETNKKTLAEVFQKSLACLKRYGLVNKETQLRTVSRGESPASALMSRLDTLARKTNYYYKYIGKGSEYFFDIERSGNIDEKRLLFLLGRVFGHFDPQCNYEEMYKELTDISQVYNPRFHARHVNPLLVLDILKSLKDFMRDGILHLPIETV